MRRWRRPTGWRRRAMSSRHGRRYVTERRLRHGADGIPRSVARTRPDVGPRAASAWARRRPSARVSALGLDDDRHLGCHARVDLDRHLVGTERLERLLEIDLVT